MKLTTVEGGGQGLGGRVRGTQNTCLRLNKLSIGKRKWERE